MFKLVHLCKVYTINKLVITINNFYWTCSVLSFDSNFFQNSFNDVIAFSSEGLFFQKHRDQLLLSSISNVAFNYDSAVIWISWLKNKHLLQFALTAQHMANDWILKMCVQPFAEPFGMYFPYSEIHT